MCVVASVRVPFLSKPELCADCILFIPLSIVGTWVASTSAAAVKSEARIRVPCQELPCAFTVDPYPCSGVPVPSPGVSLKEGNANLFPFWNAQVSSRMMQHRAEKK